jgi:hypothetical protein
LANLGSEPEALATAVRAAQTLIERALAAEEATRRPS